MNIKPDQFKSSSNKNEAFDDWSYLMQRVEELLTNNISGMSNEALFGDLSIIRGGIREINEILKNNVTLNENKMNRLYEDLDLFKQTEEKLLTVLRKRDIERSSHKEALESKSNSFLDNMDDYDLEDDEESPEKVVTPSQKISNSENNQIKCELKFGGDLDAKVFKELIKKDGEYFRKMKNGTEVKLDSQVEIQDEDDGENVIKKKVITLSMPRQSNTNVVEGLRKSHSESTPINLQVDPDLYRRHESEKDHYSDKGYEICSNQMSRKESPHVSGNIQVNHQDDQEDQEDLQNIENSGEIIMNSNETDRFKKGNTISGYEEVSGDLTNQNTWERQQTKETGYNDTVNESNVRMSELNIDKEIKIPFQDSNPPETIEHEESLDQSQPEKIEPEIPYKESIKELIINSDQFKDENSNNLNEDIKKDFEVYNNSDEPHEDSHQYEAQNSQELAESNSLHKRNVDIYSRENSGPKILNENQEVSLDETSKKFYTKPSESNFENQNCDEIDQQKCTSKEPFYSKNNSQKNKNTLDQLIRNKTTQSHRNRMNDLNAFPNSNHIPNNLESLNTVHSNWMTNRDDSTYESGHFNKQRGPQVKNEENSNEIKSLGEIVQESVSRQDQKNDYYEYKPARIERVSHPDEYEQKPRYQPKPQYTRVSRTRKENPYEETFSKPKNYIKEQRLSHTSKLVVLPLRGRGNTSGNKNRGSSIEEYNKRASSLTIKTKKISGSNQKMFRESQKAGKKSQRYEQVTDDYGLTGITSEMRRSSHKKIVRESYKGVRVSRPEFSVNKEDIKRGIKIYTGQEALSRSRHTISSDRNGERRSKVESFSPGNNWQEQNKSYNRNSQRKSLATSREIKVKIRQGKRSVSRNNQMPRGVVTSLGGYLSNNLPKGMVESINPQENSKKKVSIGGMLRNSRGRREYGRVTESITRGKNSRMPSRSGSSLKHEVKIRSISRSRNLMNLDEYCTRIERESRYVNGSISNERESRLHQNKIETLMNNLQRIKKTPSKPMNNDYYAMGNEQSKRGIPRNRVQTRNQPRSAKLSEKELRRIRNMFPFNQVWFWDMTSKSQENNLKKHNPALLNKLKIPVQILISKVKQSDHITDSKIINLSRDRIEDTFADKKIKFGNVIESKAKCRPFDQEIKMGGYSRDEEYEEQPKSGGRRPNPENREVKGGYVRGRGQKEFEDDSFGNVDFNKRRQNHEFKNINFRDKRDYNRVSHQETPKTHGFSNRTRSQVRIRNKQRNYNNKNFVHVNRKVIMNGSGRKYDQDQRSNRQINNRLRPYQQPASTYYSQRNIPQVQRRESSSRRVYLDNLRIGDNQREDDDFDDYYEEVDPPIRRNYHNKVASKNAQSRGYGHHNQPNIISKSQPEDQVFVDTIQINKDSDEESIDDDYYEEKDGRRKIKLQNNFRNRSRKGYEQSKRNPVKQIKKESETVYVDNIQIQRDSKESEDVDDDYYEERDVNRRIKLQNNFRNRQKKNHQQVKRNLPRQVERDSNKVYVDNIQIQRDSKESEDVDDDYYEERDTWRKNQKVAGQSKQSEIKQHSYFKRNGHVNHGRQDSPPRTFVDNINIKRDSREAEDDYGDDYFEERDSWNQKKEKSKAKNVFESSFVNSNIRSKESSGVQYNQSSNLGPALSSRFQSFAPHSKQGSRVHYGNSGKVNVHYAQVESKNEMSPDPQVTSRETKGPVYYNNSGKKQRKDDQKTNYTSSTYHNSQYDQSKSKKKPNVQFNNPYSAQIFTNEQTYVKNNSIKKMNERQNTYTDYYQTNKQRF